MRNYMLKILVIGMFCLGIAFANPDITLYTPINDTNFSSWVNMPPFIFNVTDATDTEILCNLTIIDMYGSATTYFNENVTNDTITSWDINTSLYGYDTEYNWSISCINSLLETNTSEIRTFLVYTPDCIPPVITLYTPLDGSSFSSLVNVPPFVFNVTDEKDDPISCELLVFYNWWFPFTYENNATNNTITSWDINSSFIDGYYGWYIECENSCGEYTESNTRTFTIYTPVEGCPDCCTNETSTNTYADVTTDYADFKTVLGLALVLLALWGIWHYVTMMIRI